MVALIAVYFVFFFARWERRGKRTLLMNTLVYAYMCVIILVTLTPVIASLPYMFNHPYKRMNMRPFDDYFKGRGDTVRQILLNVTMMVPFGFFLPAVKKRNLFLCALTTSLLSLSIELIQPLFNRASDITDLITNTAGGIIGYLLCLIFRPLLRSIRGATKKLRA